MDTEMVLPGDELAASEEYMPGSGTYERGGTIFAAVTGVKRVMEGEMTLAVIPFRKTPVLSAGDVVVGEVTGVSNALINVSVAYIEGEGSKRKASGDGVVHVSKASRDFNDDLRKLFGAGNIVRASVLQAVPSLQLSTEGEELGVIQARCPRCRSVMSRAGRDLRCNECERDERRKLASDYDEFAPSYESNKK
jgi:exosome complex component CSL4